MNALLVRMLSTGRNGTKFMASLFADQGYAAFHEDLFMGKPMVAVHQYLNGLADMWKEGDEAHYAMDARFIKPYRKAVAKELGKQGSRVKGKELRAIVHSDHRMTSATPLVLKELGEHNIASKHLILMRNPLRTIHAIYTVEAEAHSGFREYRIRPRSFYSDTGVLGAAQIWANTYRMIKAHMDAFPEAHFYVLQLEEFSSDVDSAKQAFEFLGLPFDADKYASFTQKVLAMPLRKDKEESERNSDLFRAPDFVISKDDIDAIGEEIADVLESFGRDWDAEVAAYQRFHSQEKGQLGLS